jgi:D-alanyl-D-alanine-carboxypeptidase/D-alanyl-D-alanine-endopeptidase
MVQQGRVTFDEPVRALLPPGTVGKPPGHEITLLDLATQHSGLPRMPDNFHPANPENPYADYHPADLYAFMAKQGLERPAHTEFLYSNLGFGLLGQSLADRAAEPYPELLRSEILGPLNMQDTTVTLSAAQQAHFLPGRTAEGPAVITPSRSSILGATALSWFSSISRPAFPRARQSRSPNTSSRAWTASPLSRLRRELKSQQQAEEQLLLVAAQRY